MLKNVFEEFKIISKEVAKHIGIIFSKYKNI